MLLCGVSVSVSSCATSSEPSVIVSLPVLDDRPEDEILGYDQHGLSADASRHLRSGRDLTAEADRDVYIREIDAADSRRMSVATFVETSVVIECRYGAE